MSGANVNLFLLSNGRFFDKTQIKKVKRIVEKVKDDDVAYLAILGFKNPLTMVLLSFLLGMFGVDRFLLGDIKRGLIKALMFPIEFISIFLIFTNVTSSAGTDIIIFTESVGSPFLLKLGLFFFFMFVFLAVFYVIDIFLIYGDTYNYNYKILVDFVDAKNNAIISKDGEDYDDDAMTEEDDSFTNELGKSKIIKGKASVDGVVKSVNKRRRRGGDRYKETEK